MDSRLIKDHVISMYDNYEQYHKRYSSKAGNYVLIKKVQRAIRYGAFKPGDKILEVGCANGPFVFEFLKNGFKVTGSDISPKSIQWAIEKAKRDGTKNAEFVVADAEDLSIFNDNTFDGVFSFNTLRYVPNPQLAINEIYRVLKKEKCAVLDFPNKYSPWFNLIRPFYRSIVGRHKFGFLRKCGYGHEHLSSSKEVFNLFQKAGFRNISIKRISYPQTETPDKLLKIFKILDFVSELPIINRLAGIIMCSGKK